MNRVANAQELIARYIWNASIDLKALHLKLDAIGFEASDFEHGQVYLYDRYTSKTYKMNT